MKKRIFISTIFVSLFFVFIISRMAYISFSNEFSASSGYNSYSITIDNNETNLFYSDYSKLTNNADSYCVVIRPTEKGVLEIHNKFSNSDENSIIQELKYGKPVVKDINKEAAASFKYNKVYKYQKSSYSSKQLISKSSGGILEYIDEPSSSKVRFSVDAMGRLLSGDEGEYYSNYKDNEGYVLTIDKSVQKIADNACENLDSGCVVIMDISSASVLACVTKPDSSYLNKAISQYSAGSVFKIVVALSAIENNMNLNYYCKGKVKVGDSIYSCQNNRSHKKQSLKQALANSCNCYFVNLALQLGQDKILKTAEKLGLNKKTYLYEDWSFNNADLPSRNTLKSKGQLSLFGFGQGKLTVTPMHFCNTLCTIANNGNFNTTKLLRYQKEGTVLKAFPYPVPENKFSEKDCKRLVKYLRFVVSDGTGNAADYNKKSAGKTATAQTGQFKNNTELYNTWFAGIYPYDKPKYAIVIMKEEGISGSVDCCPIFRTIVEKIDSL